MNRELYLKLDSCLNQAAILLREASTEAYLAGEIAFMVELNPIRFKLSDLIHDTTINHVGLKESTESILNKLTAVSE
jgi:hypothetical protein